MNGTLAKAFFTVIINDQAYLYAEQMRLECEIKGIEVTPEIFEGWQDDFKKESARLVEELYDEISVDDFLEDMDEYEE